MSRKWYLIGLLLVGASVLATIVVMHRTPSQTELLAEFEETIPAPLEEDLAMEGEVENVEIATGDDQEMQLEDLADEASIKKMAEMKVSPESMRIVRLDESKSTISSNLSKSAVLNIMKEELVGDTTCIPKSVNQSGLSLIFEIGRKGHLDSLQSEPMLPSFATKCLKMKFADREQELTPSDKSFARAKIHLELQ